MRNRRSTSMSRVSRSIALLLTIFTGAGSAQEPSTPTKPEDATLRFKFTFGGAIPERGLRDGSSDPFCAGCKIPDERLVIGPNRELQNVALIWDERRNKDVPKREFAKAPQRVEMEFKNCRLSPHIVVARVGQEIVLNNRDNTGHNESFLFFNNLLSGMIVLAGRPRLVKLDRSEPAPIPVECNVHPWERAFLIVKDHPYVGISNEEGVLEIQGLPVGNQWFQIWHESAEQGFQRVLWNGCESALKNGRIELKLAPGRNELGVMQLDAEQFLLAPGDRKN